MPNLPLDHRTEADIKLSKIGSSKWNSAKILRKNGDFVELCCSSKTKKNIHCFDVTTRASTVYVQPRYNLIDTVIDSSRFFVFLFFGRVLLGPGNSVAKDGGSGARSRVYIAATVFCQSGVLLSPPPHTSCQNAVLT